jgi:hypothetical protein
MGMAPRLLARARRRQRDDETQVIDLRDEADTTAWLEGLEAESPEAARAREARIAAWASRLEGARQSGQAEEELAHLRRQHWSGERILEEARRGLDWWELPDADPYAVLGLLPGASLADAATARRAIAQRCHPDVRSRLGADDDEAERRMRAANAAYDRLRQALRPH